MKILFVNTKFFLFGGAEKYCLDLARLLEEKGHKTSFFCMEHPNNIPTEYKKYFVSYFPPFEELSFLMKMKYALRFFYNFEARNKFRKLILEEKPDLVHIHAIFFQISHSIILEAKNRKLPIVMTLHEHSLICPQITMLNKGRICELCLNGNFLPCIKNRCINKSLLKSILVTLLYYFNFFVLKSLKKIDLFIAPSVQLKNKIIKSKNCQNLNIITLGFFVDANKYFPKFSHNDKDVVYFGRLSQEKGISIMLEAVKGLNLCLKIIGDGPERRTLESKVKNSHMSNVVFLGKLEGSQLINEISNCMFSILPSICNENYPNMILESFALGKPVIGSNCGGIPELIMNGERGFLFQPGDQNDLREKILKLTNNKRLIFEMGQNARQWVEKLNSDNHYERLIYEYRKLID